MAVWQIQLLGGLRAIHGNSVIAQFPSRPVAMLLARLAMEPQRRHAREELIELLWPDIEPDVGRNRLRQTLSTLRRLLEPPDVPPYSVLSADRQTVGLVADALSCDVLEFEQLLRRGSISEALERYRGDLLPGFLDEWVEDERMRLGALQARALVRRDAALTKQSQHEPSSRADVGIPSIVEHTLPSKNLPSYLGVFFGREHDQACVLEALARHRLVTLIGLGGFGKTRLAVESARVATDFDAVAFVALSECTEAASIADRIRNALRMESSQEEAMAQLCAFLGERDVLLVLDNFEQLVDEGTGVVLNLLERLPRLRCLVTSRRALNVPGEHILTIDPLPVPRSSMNAVEAVATPSLALFIDRARSARADFALTDDNRVALIQLCGKLEGLPLAIEIAASRIRSYSPTEMCAALAERFALLTRQGQRGTRYGRHASLQTTIEWSWNLLGDAQQRFFAALSVFRGGFTAAAVDAVCGHGDTRGQLETLVADSLLRANPDETGVMRFSMLETLREFVQERVGGESSALRARHRAYFLRVSRGAGTADESTAAADIPNAKQALLTAVEDRDFGCALELAVALRPYWETHGTLPDELRLLKQAVESCPRGEPSLHAGLNLLAQLTLTSADSEQARGYANRAVREAGADPVHRAAALVALARVNWERDQRDTGITESLDEAIALAASARAAAVEADALRVKATVALKHGVDNADYRSANELFERAAALYRGAGHPLWVHRVLLSRVGCLTGLERYGEARELLAQCEQYFARLDSVADLIAVSNMTGYLESAQGHTPEAVAAGRRCVQLAWERHSHLSLAVALWNLPQPLMTLGEFSVAAQLMSFAATFWQRGVGALSTSDLASVKELRKGTVKHLGAVRTTALWEQGAKLSLAEAVRLALASSG